MKKIRNTLIILTITSIVCLTKIYALGGELDANMNNNDSPLIKIPEKISITEKEKEKIMLFGYNADEINNFSKDRINSLLKIEDGSYSLTVKYFKDTYIYTNNPIMKNNVRLYIEPQVKVIDTISTEISKEEYEKLDSNDKLVSTLGSITYETTYKKLTLIGGRDALQPSKRYSYTSLQWKIMPSIRSFDVIAMKATGGRFDLTTRGGRVEMTLNEPDGACIATFDNNYTQAFSTNRSHSQTWAFDYNGIGQTVLLYKNNIKCFNDLGFPMYKTLKKYDVYFTSYIIPSSGQSSVLVNATYQHSVANLVESNVVNKYVFNPVNLGNTIHFTNGLNSSFDGMQGVNTSVY